MDGTSGSAICTEGRGVVIKEGEFDSCALEATLGWLSTQGVKEDVSRSRS